MLLYFTMQKAWIDPNEIQEFWVLNNRKENPGHIESITVSMQTHGYLPEYPLVVFKAENVGLLPMPPYVLACGHHRRKAAIEAGIGTVFCEVLDGGEDDWIETMSTDNFKYDVASNPGIGLAFTETERRAACRQLLLIPKFLERTNVSLGNEWNVPESTVRRWRSEIEEIVMDDAPVLNKWRSFQVSADRRDRLAAVIESGTRVTDEGKEVTATRKRTLDDEYTRRQFWRKVDDSYDTEKGADGKTVNERHGLRAGTLLEFCYEHFSMTWNDFPEKVPIAKLKRIHTWVLTEDAEFIDKLRVIEARKQEEEDARSRLKAAKDALMDKIREKLSTKPKSHSWSDENEAAESEFAKAVKQQYDGFAIKSEDKEPTTIDEYNTVADMYTCLAEDIDNDVEYVQVFRKEHKQYFRKKRERLESKFSTKRLAVLTAIDTYPRDISYRRFWHAFDEEHWIRDVKTADLVDPKPLEDGTLSRYCTKFERAIEDIEKDADWVKAIPDTSTVETEPPVDPEAVPARRITRILLNIEGGAEEPAFVVFDLADIQEWIPTQMLEELLRIAQTYHVSVDEQVEELESPRGGSE